MVPGVGPRTAAGTTFLRRSSSHFSEVDDWFYRVLAEFCELLPGSTRFCHAPPTQLNVVEPGRTSSNVEEPGRTLKNLKRGNL